MNCKKCGNKINVKDAKFCPFCGVEVEQKQDLAGYTRMQYFQYTGDEEFRSVWEEIRNMNVDEALSWLRSNPPAKYIYKICAKGSKKGNIRTHSINKCDVLEYAKHGFYIFPNEGKLTLGILQGYHNSNIFYTKEECEKTIKEIVEEYENRKS